jgi:large subunit ribosomal protein L19e
VKAETAKKIAAEELKAGISRVWIDTNSAEEVLESATRQDIRNLIRRNVIQARPAKGNSNARFKKRIRQRAKERRRGPGSVRGTRNARFPHKTRWIKTIRALRDELKSMKDNGNINPKTYRKYYRLIKGGNIKSRAQLTSQIKQAGLYGESK